jgi:branched-chain amino acid transport system substrate-binding protein
MDRRSFVLLAAMLALAGCGGAQPGGTRLAPSALAPQGTGLSTTAPAGRGVAILAPLSGPNAERGQALVKAAQLALSEPGSPALDVRDTTGTPAGAAAAAQAAIAAGAAMLIGPLTSAETAAAAAPAQQAGIPMLAFTSDPAQAKPGVWTLGLTPAQQVRRLVGAMNAQGKTRLAAALPQNEFGQAMATALGQATAAAGLPTPDIRTYAPGMSSINAVVRDISGYSERRGPLDAQIRAARNQHDAEGRKRAIELSRQPIAPPSFDGLLLADTGDALSTLTAMLPYYDLDPPTVRVLGPALWAAPGARGGAGLNGAWYAAPDPAARANFDQQFSAANGTPAPGLADLAYDAASIARVLAHSGGYSAASLSRPEGFAGVDGVLALQPDGSVRRGLALFEIQRGGPVMIEPAPDNLSSPGI